MKSLLTCLCTLLCAAALAQPTITGHTNNPLPGDKYHIRGCDTTGASMGPAGAGVTWDFSSLATDYVDSISFLACAATPYCDSFPGAALAVTFDGSYFDYLRADTNEFSSLGSHDGMYIWRYDDAYAITMYPMTYGTIKIDTVAQHYDTVFYAWATDTFVADGYGTLKLPSGEYDSVLRVHIIATEKDSILTSPGNYTVSHYRTESYNWYRPGFRFVLCSQYYDTAGAGTPYLADVWYCPYTLPTPPPAGLAEIAYLSGPVLYPVPADDAVVLKVHSAGKQEVRINIVDVHGRAGIEPQVHELSAGSNEISFRTSHLAPGTYLMQVSGAVNTFVKRFIVAH